MKANITVGNKYEFVKNLERLLKITEEFSELYRLDLLEGQKEYIYLTYQDGFQKRIPIVCEGCFGILKDFVKEVEQAKFIPPDSVDYRKEFSEIEIENTHKKSDNWINR